MNSAPDNDKPRLLADLPLEVRRARDLETHQELHEGLTSRHLAIAANEQAYLAGQLAHLRGLGQALAAKKGKP